MTRDEAKKYLPLIQAFAEGKTIQLFRYVDGCWVDSVNPFFDMRLSWRIKPEPREVWVSRNVSGFAWSVADAMDWVGCPPGGEAPKRYREVIE